MFFTVFDKVLQEHEVLFVILRVKVMKLQTHILQNCTKLTFTSMTFRKIRYKISVIDTNWTEVSLHEADKGRTIPRFYGVSSLCRCGKIRARSLITLRHIQLYTQSLSTGDE